MSKMARLFALFALLPGFVLLPATPAFGAGCSDGSRSQARTLAAQGGLVEEATSWFGGNGPNLYTVKLRYSSSARCAWGWIGVSDEGSPGYAEAHVWVDRSRDGGRTWEGPLGYRQLPG